MRCDLSLQRGLFRGHSTSLNATGAIVTRVPGPLFLPSVEIRTIGLASLTQPYEAISP